MEKSQGLAESLIIAGGCERLAVVVEHANVDQRRRHRQFLVAVLATSFDQHGDELRAEHLLEPRHVSLGPAVVGVADDFAGTRELLAAPGGLHGTVRVLVAARQRGRPDVHDFDRVFRVRLVAADEPQQRPMRGPAAAAPTSMRSNGTPRSLIFPSRSSLTPTSTGPGSTAGSCTCAWHSGRRPKRRSQRSRSSGRTTARGGTTAGSSKQTRRPDEAIANLRRAVTRGFKEASRMKAEAGLDVLRDREDLRNCSPNWTPNPLPRRPQPARPAANRETSLNLPDFRAAAASGASQAIAFFLTRTSTPSGLSQEQTDATRRCLVGWGSGSMRFRLSYDEVEPSRGREVQRIPDHRGPGIDGRVHLDFRQHFPAASRAEDGHEAVYVAHVDSVAGEEKTSPDGRIGLVLPNERAGRGIQAGQGSAQVPDVKQSF